MFYLTQSRLEKHCMILQKELYSIYKITVDKTGQYYFGYTKDLTKRVDNHHFHISNVVFGNENDTCLWFHQEAAKSFVKSDGDSMADVEKTIRKGLSIQVFAIVHGKKYAKILEQHYIDDNIHDKLCLNKR